MKVNVICDVSLSEMSVNICDVIFHYKLTRSDHI